MNENYLPCEKLQVFFYFAKFQGGKIEFWPFLRNPNLIDFVMPSFQNYQNSFSRIFSILGTVKLQFFDIAEFKEKN